MSFASLKKSRMNLSELQTKLKAAERGGGFKTDERFWYPARDEAGNAYAVIRFLPCVEEEELSWAKTYRHGFKGVGGWFIEDCPTTIGDDCPVCTANSILWNSGIDSDKAIARDRKRKLEYVVNIYIVSDPKNPENEGTVRLLKFGKRIFDKIMSAVAPEFEDETPINPFDLWDGANFKMKIRKVDKQVNYDKSEFDSPSQMLPSDNKMEEVWKKCYPLAPFTAKDKYMSIADLEKKFLKVIGATATTEEINSELDVAVTPAPAKTAPAPEATAKSAADDDDDVMKFFQNMAEQD